MNTAKIAFIGGGNMAASLLGGLLANGYNADLLWVADIRQTVLDQLAADYQIHTSSTNSEVVPDADVVVLAVKPDCIREVAQQIAPLLAGNTLVVSIAAAISQSSLRRWLGDGVAIVRCMPNTPALVQTGATALHANSNVQPKQRDLAENIMRAVGVCLWVCHESELDAVTAISGSGPAYFFLLMEAMEQAAAELGLGEEDARLLVQQTALGASKIAIESPDNASQLRHKVTSPGGTTAAALQTLEQGRFAQLVAKALHAARDRSVEMCKELEDK